MRLKVRLFDSLIHVKPDTSVIVVTPSLYKQPSREVKSKEVYICPFCLLEHALHFYWKSYEKYPCESVCPRCNQKYHGVDSLDRCKRCHSRVECLVDAPIVIATEFKHN